VTSFRMHKVS